MRPKRVATDWKCASWFGIAWWNTEIVWLILQPPAIDKHVLFVCYVTRTDCMTRGYTMLNYKSSTTCPNKLTGPIKGFSASCGLAILPNAEVGVLVGAQLTFVKRQEATRELLSSWVKTQPSSFAKRSPGPSSQQFFQMIAARWLAAFCCSSQVSRSRIINYLTARAVVS